MHVLFDSPASPVPLRDSGSTTFDLAQAPGHQQGVRFDRRPFGNLGHTFQVRNAAGDYELYFESRIGEAGLVWTNRGRPIDMRGDYRYTVDFPIPRQLGTPFAERLNEVARELDQRARRATANPALPLSDNPFVRFGNAMAGAGMSLIGDPLGALAGVAPYFAVSPSMFQDPAMMGVARDLSRTASGAVDPQLREWLSAVGIGVDTAEFEFGINAFRIASLCAGAYALAEGGLRLVRVAGEVRIAGQNLHVLASFENLSRGKIGQVARFIDNLTPQDIAAFDPALLQAMRSGLARHSGDATARAALTRLDDLARGRIVVTPPGGGAGAAGGGAGHNMPDMPRLNAGRGESIELSGSHGPAPRPRGSRPAASGGSPAGHRTDDASSGRDASARITDRAQRLAEADRARSAALREAANRHPIAHSPEVSIQRPYESWESAGQIATRHNAGAPLRDVVVRLPFERRFGDGETLREIALLRGDALALQRQVDAFVESGSVPRDFDLRGAAAQVGVDWAAARQAAAQARVLSVAINNPLTIAGYDTFAMPDAERAETESLRFNGEADLAGMIALPLRILRNIADGMGDQIAARSEEVWVGPPERARGAVAALGEQGRLAPGQDFAAILARAGLTNSFASREQAGLDLQAARIEAEQPTTYQGSAVGVQPSREAAVGAVMAHNAEAQAGIDPLWLYLPLENRITGPGLPEGARGRAHTIYAGHDFGGLESFYETMRAQGRLPESISFDALLREAGIAGRFAAWRVQEQPQTPEPERASHRQEPKAEVSVEREPEAEVSVERETDAASHGELPEQQTAQRGDVLTSPEMPDFDDPSKIISFIRDRRLESWEGDGIDDLDAEALDRAAATLYALDFSAPGGIGFFDDDLRAAIAAIRRAGGRAFPDPVMPGEPGYEAMPRAVDYGLPERAYHYVGMDDDGHPIWRGEDGRHVGPFAREPSGAFSNPSVENEPPPARFPFNPTAPGAMVPLAPPGAMVEYNPDPYPSDTSRPVTREELLQESRDLIDAMIGMIRDAGFDLRAGLNVAIRDPFMNAPVLRSTGAVGLDTLREINTRRAEIMRAAGAGDVRTLLDIFAHALGVGARIGEGLHEPQVVRMILQELIGLRGLGINSALQWKAEALEGYAERSFLGEVSPFEFTPDPEKLSLEADNPGFARLEGRLSLNVTRLSPEEAEGAVDIFGNGDSELMMLNEDLRIGKTMFEFYTPSFGIGPLQMPGAEYREELAQELIIPAGSYLPREFVSVINRAIGDGHVEMRLQVDYRDDPEGQATLRDELIAGLGGDAPLAGQPGFLQDFGRENIQATYHPGLRARLSAPPGRTPHGRDTIDANFPPSEHFVNWMVSVATGGAVHLPMDRAVPGELDVAARFAPDALHGYADKVRIKLNLGPSASLGDIIGLRTAFYLVRESRPEGRTALLRSTETATVTFEDSFAQERQIDVPVWLSMMLGEAVAPGQVEAALGLQPLPPGGIVIPPGGSESLRAQLEKAWFGADPDDQNAIAAFIADHLAGAEPAFADGRTLMPALKDELILLLHRIATPRDGLAAPEEAGE
ncbi:MAG: hypothetical protein JJU21_02655 [Salinarimonas sp.]|nr:hypothetical protein [Salinarimonas sp.]